jgi:hypothetical protein
MITAGRNEHANGLDGIGASYRDEVHFFYLTRRLGDSGARLRAAVKLIHRVG